MIPKQNQKVKNPQRKLTAREQRLNTARERFDLQTRTQRLELLNKIIPELVLASPNINSEELYEQSCDVADQFQWFLNLTTKTVIAEARNRNNPEFAAGDILYEWLDGKTIDENNVAKNATVQTTDNRQATWDEMLSTAKSVKDIMDTEYPDIKWIADGLIPQGFVLLAAQSKIGKSWFALQLALCAAAGNSFLGSVSTTPAKVMYIALEDTERRIQSRINKMGLSTSEKCSVLTKWMDAWDALEYAIKRERLSLVIIDTWGRFVSAFCKDGNDYSETTRLASHLHQLAVECETTIVVVHHTKKGAGSADWLDDVMGSKALAAVADTIISITRERNAVQGELKITGRDVAESTYQIEHGDDWRWVLSETQELTAGHRRVLEELAKPESADGTSARTLQHRINLFRSKGGKEELETLLLDLKRLGYVEPHFIQQSKQGAKPVEHWSIISPESRNEERGALSVHGTNIAKTREISKSVPCTDEMLSMSAQTAAAEPVIGTCEVCRYYAASTAATGGLCRAGRVQGNGKSCPKFNDAPNLFLGAF